MGKLLTSIANAYVGSRLDLMNKSRKSKVFCIGMFKTGTTSMTRALEILGYQIAKSPETDPINTGAYYRGKSFPADLYIPKVYKEDHIPKFVTNSPEWDSIKDLAQRGQNFGDAPWLFLFKEFDDLFPNSKFILTLKSGGGEAVALSDRHHWKRVEINKRFNEQFTDDEIQRRVIDRYNIHIRSVRDYFRQRPDDLLEITLGEGDEWRKLCSFLELDLDLKKLPPFPHQNKNSSFLEKALAKLESFIRR